MGPVASGAIVGGQRADARVRRSDVGSTIREGWDRGKEQPDGAARKE
jgi:hypothetical protein